MYVGPSEERMRRTKALSEAVDEHRRHDLPLAHEVQLKKMLLEQCSEVLRLALIGDPPARV